MIKIVCAILCYNNSKIIQKLINDIKSFNKINKIDLIKIDTEGHEFNVLQSGKSILKNIKYLLIEINYHYMYLGYKRHQIERFLKKNKFILIKTFFHPLSPFSMEDRLYIKIL